MMAAGNIAALRKEFAQLSAQANARIKSLKKGRYRSPAVEKLREQGIRKFGVRAQKLETEADFRKAIRQARNFLNAETSTRKGLKKVTKEMMRNFEIEKKGGEGLAQVTRKSRKLFDLYDDLKELYQQGKISSADKYDLIEMMSQMYDEGLIDSDTSASEITAQLEQMIQAKKNMRSARQSTLNFSFQV